MHHSRTFGEGPAPLNTCADAINGLINEDMERPRRPALRMSVRVAPVIALELDEESAFAALGAVHDARVALRALPSPPTGLIDTLALHERELGVALGADRARAWLRRRAGR